MSEPTNEQLESIAIALGLPVLPERLRPPYWRESMLNLHSLVQRTVGGDVDAAAALARLVDAFGRTEAA